MQKGLNFIKSIVNNSISKDQQTQSQPNISVLALKNTCAAVTKWYNLVPAK